MCRGEGGVSPTDAAVVSSHSCSGDDNNGVNNNGILKSMPKPSRTMKRALVGTVGAGLAAGAAVLLTNSDEFGEWLHVMAPHVMPAAGAGAEIVHRAIEASKVCFEEGVNICLDAEGHITLFYSYLSQWYLSPKQHVVEMALSILLLAPMVFLYFRACRARVRQHLAAGTFGARAPRLAMKLWAAALLLHVSLGAFLKLTKNELVSHPAYLWQPCHVHSFVMGVCTFAGRRWSMLTFHVAATLWWGPFLAFVAPSLPIDPVEIFIFWVQHALMLMAPMFRLTLGASWMYNDFWWNSVGFLFLTCYHWWWLGPVNIVTGVNVATMTVPPDSLIMLGKYYRFVWGVMCIALQLMAVAVLIILARTFGQWPSSSVSKSIARDQPPVAGAADGSARVGDGAEVSTEKTVELANS